MKIVIRLEARADYRDVEVLTREAFWGYTDPTCDEHYLVHTLRGAPAFVPELDYVAEVDGKLAGNVMYSKAKVVDADNNEHEVLTFGPLSVLPSFWGCGVGSALMRHTIGEAKRLGHAAIVFYGHPDYYPRFGFRSAGAYGITTPDGKNFDALMGMPLFNGALDGVAGAFHEDPLFQGDAQAAQAYNRNFTHKEPAAMASIDVLLNRLQPAARKAFEEREITTLAWLNRMSGREMLTWKGIDNETMGVINRTLKEYGYAEKLMPASYILKLAEMGIRISVVTRLRSEDGISAYKVESEGERYILVAFDGIEDADDNLFGRLCASYGAPASRVLKHTKGALLLSDAD